MKNTERKEPYYNIKLEGDFTNWTMGGSQDVEKDMKI